MYIRFLPVGFYFLARHTQESNLIVQKLDIVILCLRDPGGPLSRKVASRKRLSVRLSLHFVD